MPFPATTGKVKGNLLQVYVAGSLIGCATSNSFEGSLEMVDATCKANDGASDSRPGQLSWSISTDALFAFDANDGIDEMMTAWLAKQSVTVKFSTGVVDDKEISGSAYITSININAGLNEIASWSVTFQGIGTPTYDLID